MDIRAALTIIVTMTVSACAWWNPAADPDGHVQATVISTDQAVQQFLTGRELDSIEGAWTHDESAFEVVISQNSFGIADGYDYVGIITRSDQPNWNRGDVKLLLRKTENDEVFEGVWMTRFKSEREMTFLVEHANLIQANFVSNRGDAYFVRIRRMNPSLATVR